MLVVLPTTRKDAEIDRAITNSIARVKRRNQTLLATWRAWMPYHRIRISCSNLDTSRIESVATALNAVFCASAKNEGELLQLFRPKHLELPLKEIEAEIGEVVFPHPEVDLNAIVDRLVKVRGEARSLLSQIERQLINVYRAMQWRHLFLPTPTSTLERETEASGKLAELRSLLLAVDICLNLTRNLLPRKVEGHDVFYAPMAVFQLRESGIKTARYVLVDLTTRKIDETFTNLCSQDDDFRSDLELGLGKMS